MNHIETGNSVELLFEVMQPGYRSCPFLLVRSDAAQRYGVGNACPLNGRANCIADAILIRTVVCAGEIRRYEDIRGAGPGERARQRLCVRQIRHKCFGAFADEALQLVCASPDDAHFLFVGQQGIGND